MIAELEGGLDSISKSNQLSKGMKQQFDNVIAEVRRFKSTMEKECFLYRLLSGCEAKAGWLTLVTLGLLAR